MPVLSLAGAVILQLAKKNNPQKQQIQKYFTTEAQRAQSSTLLTAPAALLTIYSFSLCLCGEIFFSLFMIKKYKQLYSRTFFPKYLTHYPG
jgi:hypothetical protein